MKSLPLVSIGIVLFRGEKYLPFSLSSLFRQTYPNIEFLIRDHSPNGEAIEYIQKNIFELPKNISLEHGENLFHSGGHNALIQKMKGEYYVCASFDALYDEHAIENLVKTLEKKEYQSFSSVAPKLYHWDFSLTEKGELNRSKTTIIDSAGLIVEKNHEASDKGVFEKDHPRYRVTKEVFGASGAFFMVQKSALEKIAFENENHKMEYFDELLHYKNDVDLFYRLRLAGERCLFVPSAIAWHARGVGKRTKKSAFEKENSLFGHFVVVKKNFSLQYSFSTILKTSWAMLKRWIYSILFQRKALFLYKKSLPEILKKRAGRLQLLSPEEMDSSLGDR